MLATAFVVPEPSGILFWIFVVIMILFLIIKLQGLSRQEIYAVDLSEDEDNFYEDPDLINEIKEAVSTRQLMGIVDDEMYNETELCGEENNVLMAKALSFESELCRHDWAHIYYIAEEGSMLEKVAEEKAGRALEEEV